MLMSNSKDDLNSSKGRSSEQIQDADSRSFTLSESYNFVRRSQIGETEPTPIRPLERTLERRKLDTQQLPTLTDNRAEANVKDRNSSDMDCLSSKQLLVLY